jgi:hypothetical protein
MFCNYKIKTYINCYKMVQYRLTLYRKHLTMSSAKLYWTTESPNIKTPQTTCLKLTRSVPIKRPDKAKIQPRRTDNTKLAGTWHQPKQQVLIFYTYSLHLREQEVVGDIRALKQKDSLEFFSDIIFPVALWSCGRLSLYQKREPGVFPGCKGGRCVRLTILPPFCTVFMKSGNLNFLEPSGPPQACNGTAWTTKVWSSDIKKWKTADQILVYQKLSVIS